MKEEFQCMEWTLRKLKGTIGVLIFVAGISAVLAQLPTATILGVVRDSSGAVVPGATVTASNTQTGQVRTAVSGGNGSYRLAALPVGNYEVRVSTAGFQTQVRSGITLTVSQEAVVNFNLEVGAVEQTVEVTAEAPLVNTTSGSLGGLVDEQSVADLPLNGRNFIDLTLLQTGVQQHKNINYVAGMAGTWFSSNGAPLRSNNMMLDGASMQNGYGGSSASVSGATLGVEGIREYRVVTNSFTAEYGMTMGSQMVIVSKGGTNQFHGTAFEYLRNNALDARNFFDLKTETNPERLPPFKRNNFGGSIGGPIIHDKTFFHTTYEGVRERLGITTVGNAMPLGCRVEGQLCNLGTTSFTTPAIASVTQPLLPIFPEPNLAPATATGLPRYTFPFTQPTREDYGQVRVDHNFSQDDTLFGRFTIQDSEQTKTLSNPNFVTNGLYLGAYSTLSESHIFSPTVLNTARYSYSRTNIVFRSPSKFIGPQFSMVPGLEIGSVTPGSGVGGFGPDGPSPIDIVQNIFTWSDDLYWTRGAHSLKFGTLINRYQSYLQISTFNQGTISFSNLIDFLQGVKPSSYAATSPDASILDRTYHYTTLGFYVQDDWQVMPRFTLNLGLRYEFITTPSEVRGRGAAIRDIQRDADTTLGPHPFENPSYKNFSPRFGFAWDMQGNGMTALRGGFGLLYDVGNLNSALIVGTTATPPFSARSTARPKPGAPLVFTLPFVFTDADKGKSARTVDYLIQQPHMLQYNLTIERQLPWGMGATMAYGGSRGINIVATVEGNPTLATVQSDGRLFWDGSLKRTNPNWGNTEFKTASMNSWYNSFQFGLSKRMSNGLQFQSSYTWAKSIDETQSQLGAENNASGSTNAWSTRRSIDKALSSFDLVHNWRFNTIYRLPSFVSSGGAAAKLLNGWWMSGILSIQGGYPFSPSISGDRARKGGGDDRPDILSGRNNDNIVKGGPEQYFDPAAFALQTQGHLGNSGRNILRAPGFANLDFSLVKDTSLGFLGEAGKLEFRSEFFNILNRVNFTTPSRNIFSGTNPTPLSSAGQISDTIGTSRQIQLALKLIF
ncbi:MAG: TonB-dependent receptor [Acidobacteria bacterium]|nr:TonB-dependent receptor [Acidobacteriota bacterium]